MNAHESASRSKRLRDRFRFWPALHPPPLLLLPVDTWTALLFPQLDCALVVRVCVCVFVRVRVCVLL